LDAKIPIAILEMLINPVFRSIHRVSGRGEKKGKKGKRKEKKGIEHNSLQLIEGS
jgi:hypothetical protein